jgi:hypothetical protein
MLRQEWKSNDKCHEEVSEEKTTASLTSVIAILSQEWAGGLFSWDASK